MTTRRGIKKALKITSVGIFCLTILIYGLFKARNILVGATLVLKPPIYATTTPSLVFISGEAGKTSFLSMNGRKIFTDEAGNFKEQLLLFPGYNIIQVEAVDRFGKKETRNVELIYKQS